METILGIDLGTTNSVAAAYRDGRMELIKEDGQALLPSVVGLDEGGQLLVGVPARNQYVLAPERTVRSIKRKMGRDETVRLGETEYSPQEISAIILRTIKERAERQLGTEISKAVITVPAFFGENQREATREAGELAGLEVVRIINEPTAAALTYDPDPAAAERLLVYDLGGGTFDVSVVQMEAGVVEVLASHGDTQLGGDDFDQLLLDYVCDWFEDEHDVDLRDSLIARSRLLHAAEEAKKQLSSEAVVRVQEEFLAEKNGAPLHLDLEIARVEYEKLIDPLLAKTLRSVDDALTEARLQARQIDYVVLVGGASRTPLVHRLLRERLGQPLHMEVDPDLCVAMGAAIQGARIAGVDAGPVLVDITPHTLGIRAFGPLAGFSSENCFAPIIERNSPLPASRSEMFGTMVDGQEAAVIDVYQGENDDVRYNQKVGGFLLEGLADVERGNEVQVRFNLDLDGILTVTATERSTGLEEQLVIDNPMQRFRQKNRQEAQERMADAFGTAAEPTPVEPAETAAEDESLSPELKQTIRQAEHMIVRGERLVPQVGEDDASELKTLIDRLRTAVEKKDEAEIKQHLAALDDLVFYLQDA